MAFSLLQNPEPINVLEKTAQGTYNVYKLNPTNLMSDNRGTYAAGGNVQSLASGISAEQIKQQFGLTTKDTPYVDQQWISDYTSRAVKSDQQIKEAIYQQFEEMDKTGSYGTWLKQNLNSLVQSTKSKITADPSKTMNILGDIWNQYRYNPSQAGNVEQARIASGVASDPNSPFLAGGGMTSAQKEAGQAGAQSFASVPTTQSPTANQGTTQTVQQPTINFIKGLNQQQIDSINNLVKNRPSSQWSETDVKNWNYATGKQALPSGVPTWMSTYQSGGISTNTMGKEKNIDLGTGGTQAQTGTLTGDLAQIKSEIEARRKLQEETMTPDQLNAKQLGTDIQDLIGKTAGQAQYKAEQMQKLVDPLQTQLDSLYNQIDALTAEKNAEMNKEVGKSQTLARLQGRQAWINSTYNAEILTKTAQANALMRNIETATNQVNRAVELKYGGVLEQLGIKQAQLKSLQDSGVLTSAQKEQADALNNYYDAQAQAVKDQQNAEKEEKGYIIDLMSKYPDAGISFDDTLASAQSKLKNSKIYQQATRLAGGGGGGTPGPGGFPKGFWSQIDSAKNELQQGEPWGNVWNRVKMQFPTVNNSDIDKALGTDWREPGAYQEFKGKIELTPQQEVQKLKDEGFSEQEILDKNKYPESVISDIFKEPESNKPWYKFW